MLGTASLVFLLVDERSDLWTYGIPAIALYSLGLAALVAPITATALKAAPEEHAGIASGVNSTVSRLGSLISVAVIGAVIAAVFGHDDAVPLAKDQADPLLRADSVHAFRLGMLVAVGLAFAGAALGLAISNREARGEERTGAPGPALGTE
jgi:MFS family permease